MKVVTLYLLVSFISAGVFAQARITGKITGSDGKPISFANVSLLHSSDSLFIKGSMSNDSGEYSMDWPDTCLCFLRYSAVGFLTYNSPAVRLQASQGIKNLGTLVMEGDGRQMKEVVVKAQKSLIQQDMDRMTINAQSSILTAGSSVLEVLGRSPGVVLDRQHNKIILNGKNGVLVMINGKLTRLPPSEIYNLLDGMSANNIEKIELMAAPPAKYDAEGGAGIINIVLKKNENLGTNGSFSLTGGYGMEPKSVASLNINHRNATLNIYGSYSYTYDKTYWGLTARPTFQFPYDVGKGNRASDFLNERRPAKNVHNATIGVDYNINQKTTIGISSVFSGNLQTSKGYTRAKYTIYGDSILILGSDMHEKNNLLNSVNDINFERILGKDEKINFDVGYIYYNDKNPSDYNNTFLDKAGNSIVSQSAGFFPQQTARNVTDIDVMVYKADYEKRLNPNARLEAGFKESDSRIVNSVALDGYKDGVWRTDSSVSGQMTMKDRVSAVYTSLDLNIKKTSINVGLRYEHTTTDVGYNVDTKEGFHRGYGNFFPSVFIRQKLSEDANIRLTYNRRITRPAYSDIAPTLTFNDIYSIVLGNASLKPVITDNLQVQYQFRQCLFSLQLSRDKNPIVSDQQTESPSDSLFYQMSQNLKYRENITLQSTFPVQINAWWKMSNTLSAGVVQFATQPMPQYNYVKTPFTTSFFSYSLNCTQKFELPKSFSVELSGEYYSMDWWGIYKQDPFGVLNLGVKKDLKNIGTIQLSVSDLLESTHYHTHIDAPNTAYNVHSDIDIMPESRKSHIIRLTFSKSFGNNKLKSQRQWDTGSKDEQNRIRKD